MEASWKHVGDSKPHVQTVQDWSLRGPGISEAAGTQFLWGPVVGTWVTSRWTRDVCAWKSQSSAGAPGWPAVTWIVSMNRHLGSQKRELTHFRAEAAGVVTGPKGAALGPQT